MRVENDGDDIYKKISTPNECNGNKVTKVELL